MGKVGTLSTGPESDVGYGGVTPKALRMLLTIKRCFISSLATLRMSLVASPSIVIENIALRYREIVVSSNLKAPFIKSISCCLPSSKFLNVKLMGF
jgi:hypothetical protein